MNTGHHLISFGSIAMILWSLSLAGETFAQEHAVDPPRPSTSVTALATCSPDGEFFVVATAEGRITYSRTSDGATLRTFYQCHPRAVEFSPNGRLLASVGASNGSPVRIKVWNVDDGKLLCRLETEAGTRVHLDETSTGQKCAKTFPKHLAPLTGGKALAFSPDGQWLLAAGNDAESVAWNISGLCREFAPSTTVEKHIVINGHSAGLAFSRDGTRFTSGNSVWSAHDGTLLTGTGTVARKGRPAFDPDGKYVANGLSLQNARTGRTVTSIDSGFGKRNVYGVAFSPDGTTLAIGNGDSGAGILKLFAVPGGEEVQTFIGHTNPVWDVAFSPDGRFLVSASGHWGNMKGGGGPGEARLWEVSRGETMQIHETRFPLYSISFSGDGRRFAASGGAYHVAFKSPKRGEIRVWDATSGEEVFSAGDLSSCVYSVALSPDGNRLVAAVSAAGEDGPFDVKLWDVETSRELTTLGRHEKKVYGVAFSADGKRVASGGLDGTIKIYSLD